jgi:hypothetical protein
MTPETVTAFGVLVLIALGVLGAMWIARNIPANI